MEPAQTSRLSAIQRDSTVTSSGLGWYARGDGAFSARVPPCRRRHAARRNDRRLQRASAHSSAGRPAGVRLRHPRRRRSSASPQAWSPSTSATGLPDARSLSPRRGRCPAGRCAGARGAARARRRAALFLVAGWDVRGWALGAMLWAECAAPRCSSTTCAGTSKPAASGVAGVRALLQGARRARRPRRRRRHGRGSRAAGDPRLRARLHRRARPLARHVLREREVKRALALVTFSRAGAAARRRGTGGRGGVQPVRRVELHEWVPIHLGPLDLSINKAVAYLMLGALLSIVLGIVLMRVRLRVRPGRARRSARSSTRSRRRRSPSRGCRRRRSAAGSPTSPR